MQGEGEEGVSATHGEKRFSWPAFVVLCLVFLMIGIGMAAWNEYIDPNPARVLSRMERRDPERAQEILDSYGEALKSIAAATQSIAPDDTYSYALNVSTDWYAEELNAMPPELADALVQMEQEFPECELSLELHTGQVGVWLTDDGNGFSFLCYPGEELIGSPVNDVETGTRCLELEDSWVLQMYYAPKG